MSWHREIWTYLIVTLVSMLIWAWAASETRERKVLGNVSVRFAPETSPGDWTLSPALATVQVNVEGPKIAVGQVERLLRRGLEVKLPTTLGRRTLDLAAEMRHNDEVGATGASIVSTDPATIDLETDKIERRTVPVKPVVPGVTFEGEITVQPQEVRIALPSALAQRLPADFAVEAFIERPELDRLEEGRLLTLDARLRLPEVLAGSASDIRLNPPTVKVSFTIRSRIRETRIESVRVQLAGPPEDRETYRVDVDPKVLRNVTLLADADLSRRIEAGDVPVIALVQLRSSEKEALIKSKPVSAFLAIVEDAAAPGGMRYEQLRLPPGQEMPEIKLSITPRTTGLGPEP